jgi:hypothetical protein
MWHVWGGKEVYRPAIFWLEDLKGKNCMEDRGVDQSILELFNDAFSSAEVI